MSKAPDTVKLRRTSFKIMSGCFTLVFGMAAIGALLIQSAGLEGGPMAGAAASFGTITLTRRIWNSRIILDESMVIVVNPLVTYFVPYRSISDVTAGRGRTLTITTRNEDEIYSTAFGGSLIDHFVGSTERAVDRIKERLKYVHDSGGKSAVNKKLTISWVADICIICAAICVAIAATIGI